MQPLTSFTPGRKRLMILAPDINPHSFVLLFEKGDTGFSYSLRDYSTPDHVKELHGKDLGCPASEIRQRATHTLDAPVMDTARLADWHAYTVHLNRQYGIHRERNIAFDSHSDERKNCGQFPILNSAALYSLPKATKTGDIDRMLCSPNSEDWVTWNLLTLLSQTLPQGWWQHLLDCATRNNPTMLVEEKMAGTIPQLHFWRRVPSPADYEAASRARMRQSRTPGLVARSRAPRPVEGDSEIDVVIEADDMLVYIEAKLGADISMRTSHDPDRNQIARNIDCLVEAAEGRQALFWMFVRDASSSRAYEQLIQEYRRNPSALRRDLPHRDPSRLDVVARSLTTITWIEIASEFCTVAVDDDDVLTTVKQELLRRINPGWRLP
jgi:hypothetical protein